MTPRPRLEPTDAQLEEVHGHLRQLHGELVRLIADEAGLAGTVHLDQSAMGRVSRVDALQQQEMAKATRRRHEARQARVQAALERFATEPEEFGWCPDCGETIGLRRLRAFPESIFCVPCLEARGG